MYQIKKIGPVRPMGNTLRVRLMSNSETNGQPFFRKARVLPIGLTHCICRLEIFQSPDQKKPTLKIGMLLLRVL
jgi:hypothetical protein